MTRRWSLLTSAATALVVSLPVAAGALAAPAGADTTTANRQASTACAGGAAAKLLARDDDYSEAGTDYENGVRDLALEDIDAGTWDETQYNPTLPVNPQSGDSSWFAYDPTATTPSRSRLASTTDLTVPSGRLTYLHFQQSYNFASGDGGLAYVQVAEPTVEGEEQQWKARVLPTWVNGPDATLPGGSPAWSGDSRRFAGGEGTGYVSSRLDVSSLAGQRIRVVFRVMGGLGNHADQGWWVDDVRVYSCPRPPHYSTIARTSAVAKVKKRKAFVVTTTVTRRGVGTRVAGLRVTLQRHLVGKRVWRTVSAGPTNARGTRAWRVRQSKRTVYRAVVRGAGPWLGTTSAARRVGIRR